jgi:hypothetical protein
MDIKQILENSDGSATLKIDMTDEERDIFISHAVNDILRKKLCLKSRVLITVEGGVVQDVCCDGDLDLEIIELDFDRVEEANLVNRYECREDTDLIDKAIKEHDKDRFEEGDI